MGAAGWGMSDDDEGPQVEYMLGGFIGTLCLLAVFIADFNILKAC